MRRVLILGVIMLLALSASAMAAEWIAYPELQGDGWTTIAGAGYNGTDAYRASGQDGVRRAIWKFDFADMPTTPTLMEIWVYGPTAGAHSWQPVEVIFNGSAGDVFPVDPNIPWEGMYGTNHQYLGNDWNGNGTWTKSGPGPQSPDQGDKVYVMKGSWLYVKWDFGWSIDNTVSAVKLVGPAVPEPSSFLALAAGLPALALLRRKH